MDISSLLSSLSQDDIEKLKTTAQQFFGTKEEKKQPEQQVKKFEGTDAMFDPKILTGVAKLSGMLNESDEKSNFILALKPLLSENRRKKADEAIMMLKLMRVINIMQGSEK